MNWKRLLLRAVCVVSSVTSALAVTYEASPILPPPPAREFRGAWVATVNNTVWPSRKGLSSAEQQAELIAILDRAVQLKLNAIIFQVRTACDALYASRFEPWSEYLTGTMGRPPQPFYDPLTFAVEEAHKRGLELHAWFNPFRALHPSATSAVASNHVSRLRPNLVRRYGDYLWLDPGEKDVQEYSISVVMDVVRRYDVDGVHFDDYFYPEREDSGASSDFPDEESWGKYGAASGLSRADWRRENVNAFIQRVYNYIKAAKPWVKFGISPFGIWRPGSPPQIRGKDAYAVRYADSRKWLVNGWLDYFAPQLYWPIQPKEQSFPALLNWWAGQNVKGRHLWPGIFLARADQWKEDEIPGQIQLTRRQPGASGFIFYSAGNLMRSAALAETVQRSIGGQPALVPASPWLKTSTPAKPKLSVRETHGSRYSPLSVSWETSGEPVWEWVLQFRGTNDVWTMEILPAGRTTWSFQDAAPDIISIRAVNRVGGLSPPATLKEGLPPNARANHKSQITN